MDIKLMNMGASISLPNKPSIIDLSSKSIIVNMKKE